MAMGTFIFSQPGDPTFMHKDFLHQPVFDYLKQLKASFITIVDTMWKENALGAGWSWDDYNEAYMAERSGLPICGNIFTLSGQRIRFIIRRAYLLQFP